MPIPWLTVLSNVPWSEVIKTAPKVADGARKLWQNLGNKQTEAEPLADAAEPVEREVSAHVALQARVYELEARVADLHAQMRASSELIKALADQNTQLIGHVELNRVHLRRLIGALAALAVLALAALAVALGR